MTKRITAIMLCLLLLLPFGSVPAAAAAAPKISAGTAQGNAGATVEIPVTLAGNPGLAIAVMNLEYDKTRLKLVGVSNTALLKEFNSDTANLSRYPFVLSWQDGLAKSDNTKNGVIVKLKFQILSSAKPGNAAVTLKTAHGDHSFLNASLASQSISLAAGRVTVVCNHDAGKWVTVKAATTAAAGKQELRCGKCAAVLQTKTLPIVPYVKLNKTSLTLGVGQGYTLKATQNTNASLKWKSGSTAVAAVSTAGKITAKKAGTSKITVTASNGKTASCAVTVKPAPSSVKLSKTSASMAVGSTLTLTVSLSPSGTAAGRSWKSGNTAVLTVDSAGKITAKKAGTTTVTVTTHNGKKASCTVKVLAQPTSVRLDKSSAKLGVGQSLTLKATLAPSGASAAKSWKSSNSAVVSVSSAGKITGKKTGKATVTVTTANGKTASCAVTVAPAPTAIVLGVRNASLAVGKTLKISSFFTPLGAESTRKWTSGNTKIAAVAQDGTVTAKAAGTVTITVTAHNGVTASCKITVTSPKAASKSQSLPRYQSGTVSAAYGYAAAAVSPSVQTAAKEAIRAGLARMDAVIELSSYALPFADFAGLYGAVINENPELFHVTSNYNVSYYTDSMLIISLTPSYSDSKSNVEKMRKDFDAAAAAAVAAVPKNISDAEKVLAVNEYLVLNTAFAGEDDTSAFTAYHALVEKRAVCQGYALAFSLIMEKLGVTACVVTSSSMKHMWNMVELDGKWYHVDVTWNDPEPDVLGGVLHKYLLLSDAKIRDASHKHTGWNTDAPKTSDKKYDNYFWRDAETALVYLSGRWFYFPNTTAQKHSLTGYRFSDASKTVIKTISAAWPKKNGGSTYFACTPKLAVFRDRLIYTTNTEIRAVTASGGGDMLLLQLKLTAPNAIFEMRVSGDTLTYRTANAPLSAAYSEKTVDVYVLLYPLGDINSDGRITPLDAALLQRCAAGWSGIILDEGRADINKDGQVDAADALLLRRYAAGWDVSF